MMTHLKEDRKIVVQMEGNRSHWEEEDNREHLDHMVGNMDRVPGDKADLMGMEEDFHDMGAGKCPQRKADKEMLEFVCTDLKEGNENGSWQGADKEQHWDL